MSKQNGVNAVAHPLGVMDPKARVITIRISPELHAALVDEAFERRTSVNQLAIAKLRLCGRLLDRALQASGVELVHR